MRQRHATRQSARAEQAFAAHAALLKAQRDEPALRDNPFWTLLRQDAYERFIAEFDKAGA